MSSFTFVRVPADEAAPLEEVSAVCGGLEADVLKELAKAHFARAAAGRDDAAALAAAREADIVRACAESGQAAPDPALLAHAAAHAAAVEITLLTVPLPPTFLSVALYSDPEAARRGGRVNARATALASACGHPPTTQLLGDVFLGRCKDDERGDAWLRVSITAAEASPAAPWAAAAAAANRDKALRGFSTSSAMQGMMAQLKGAGGAGPAVVTDEAGAEGAWRAAPDGSFEWRECASEEGAPAVEARLRVPKGTRAKACRVTIAATRAGVALLEGAGAGGGLATAGGAELWAPIRPGDSSWALDGDELTLQLVKADPAARWGALLK